MFGVRDDCQINSKMFYLLKVTGVKKRDCVLTSTLKYGYDLCQLARFLPAQNVYLLKVTGVKKRDCVLTSTLKYGYDLCQLARFLPAQKICLKKSKLSNFFGRCSLHLPKKLLTKRFG